MPIAGGRRIIVNYAGLPGQGYAVNVLAAIEEDAGDVDQARADAVAAVFAASFTSTDWHIAMHGTLASIELWDLSVAHPIGYLSPINEDGSGGSSFLPAQCSLVTSLRTGLGGRSGRGRIFNPGLVEGALIGNGHVDPAVAAAFSGAWGDVLTNLLGDAGLALGVHSRVLNEINAVTGLSTNTEVDTQDRRRR